MVTPARDGGLRAPSRTPRPDVRLDLIGALATTGVAVLVYVLALQFQWRPEASAAVALFAAAPLAAGFALPVLVGRARAERDDALAWFATGLAASLVAMVLQLISFPLVSAHGGPFHTGDTSSAVLYLLFHQWFTAGALAGALGLPPSWRPWCLLVATVISLLAALDMLPMPVLLLADGSFTPLLVGAELTFAAISGLAVVLWLRRVGRTARPLRAWAAVAVSLSSYDLLLNGLSGARFGSVWWSSLSMRAATYVVLAVGALVFLLTELGRLERYTDRELGRSEHELRRSLAVTDRLLGSAETLSRAASTREVANAVVVSSLSLTGLPRASVALLDQDAGRLRTIAATGYDDASLRLLRDYPTSAPFPAAAVLARDEPLFSSDPDELRRWFPAWRDLPVHQDTACLAVLPLRSAGHVVGVLVVSGAVSRPWTASDREVLRGVAAQAGQALQRALLYERQRSVAGLLQRGLLPEQLPRLPGVALAARYLPGAEGLQVGGDWYDAIPVSDGRVALVVGDVMGKGVQAATRMGQIRTAVRVLCALDPSPSAVAAGLDAVARDLDDDQIVTLVYLLLDPLNGRGRLIRVGHLPPLLVEPDGTVSSIDAGGSPPLGAPGVERAEAAFDVPPGALLVMYTDGLVEDRRSGLDDGLPALAQASSRLGATEGAEPYRGSIDELAEELLVSLGHAEAARGDDVCLLLARLEDAVAGAPRRPHCATVRLPALASSPAYARRFVAERLALHDPPISAERLEAVLLMCSELVTNAIAYADGPCDLTICDAGGRVRLEVRDGSLRLPVRRERDVTAPGGRGMHLVTTIADDWGVEVDDGKTVWVEYALQPGRPVPGPR